jgi:hypothetical protein
LVYLYGRILTLTDISCHINKRLGRRGIFSIIKNKFAMKLKFRPRLFRPSTLAFTGEALHMQGFSFFDWLHGYVYARWPYLYIGIGTGELPRNRVLRAFVRKMKRQNLDSGTFADNYHGKVVTLDAAKKLVTVKEMLI